MDWFYPVSPFYPTRGAPHPFGGARFAARFDRRCVVVGRVGRVRQRARHPAWRPHSRCTHAGARRHFSRGRAGFVLAYVGGRGHRGGYRRFALVCRRAVVWPSIPELARAVLTFPRYHFAYRPALVRAVRRAFACSLKFVPGLGLVSSPLLGTTQIDVRVFVFWDLVGAGLWASSWMLGGAILKAEVAHLLVFVKTYGLTALDVLGMAAGAFLAYRWARRLQFRRWLAKYRISPEQLDEMMRSDAPPVIFDARPEAVRRKEAHRIKGAIPLDLESSRKIDPMFHEHEVVVYCVCRMKRRPSILCSS